MKATAATIVRNALFHICGVRIDEQNFTENKQ
jgi:hypothetical protein